MGQCYVLMWVGGSTDWLPASLWLSQALFSNVSSACLAIHYFGFRLRGLCVCVFCSVLKGGWILFCSPPPCLGGIAPTWIFLGCCGACQGRAVTAHAYDRAKMRGPSVMWREGFDIHVRMYTGQMPRSKQQLGFAELPDLLLCVCR